MALKFLTFELDEGCRELRDQGDLVSLTPQSFDILCYLIAHRTRMITKSELLDVFWSAQVSEAALQKAISLLRKATGCDRQSVIRTYHGRGFRFVAEVASTTPNVQPRSGEHSNSLREHGLVAVLCVQTRVQGSHQSEALESFLDSARRCVETHHGQALRMTLDGFIASFGLETHHEDAARQAIHCAVALVASSEGSDNLDVHIGLDHGAMEMSDDADTSSWRSPGDIERGAITLASLADANTILLSAAVRQQLRDEISCEAARDGYKLSAINDMQVGVPVRSVKKATQFVGRTAEIAFLDKSLDALAQGRGHGLVLSGPAGIGKTRLLGEFLGGLDAHQFHVLKLQCLPGLSNTTLAPIHDMYRSLFLKAPHATLSTDMDAALHAELLGDTGPHGAILGALSEHQHKQESIALLTRMLGACCADIPLVLAFEDIHWLDTRSRDYLDAMIQHADEIRLLIVMTTRPTDDPPQSETMVQLSPLGHHDGLKLLYDTITGASLDAKVADDLVRRAAGNPFFIEELALAAQSRDGPSRDLPETVQAVIAVRIGALDAQARRFLYVVAVIGPAAQIDLVMHLLSQNAQEVNATAERLRAMGFILIHPGTFGFRHMLINDTAYAMLAPVERQNLHASIAAYLESDAPDWRSQPETLAWHHQEAGQTDSASHYWLAACRAAMKRLAHHDAIVFARNGLNLIADADSGDVKRALDLQIYLAYALAAIKGYGAADVGDAYEHAREINKTVRDPRANIRVLVGLWIHAWVRGYLSESLDYGQDLLDVSKVVKDPALSLQAHASIGQVLMHKGQLDGALSHLTQGLDAIADWPPASGPPQSASVACASFACWTYSLMGRASESRHLLNTSFELAHLHKNPLAQAIHFGLCAEPFMILGQIEPCLTYADRAVQTSRAHDFPFWLGTGLVMQGWALGQLGRMDAAFDAIEEGISVFEATGAGVQLANWYGLKAETLLTAGRFGDGLKASDYAIHCAIKTGDVHFLPRIHAVTARLLSELNNHEQAAHHAEMAKKRASEYGMVPKVITLLI